MIDVAKAVRNKLCLDSECSFDRGCGCLEAIDNALKTAICEERARCVAIVSAARFGEVDGDFRAVIHMIENGRTAEEIKAR